MNLQVEKRISLVISTTCELPPRVSSSSCAAWHSACN